MANYKITEAAYKRTPTIGIKTPCRLIEYALCELVRHKQQRRLLTLKGAIQWGSELEMLLAAE